jgi:hypothetical protein
MSCAYFTEFASFANFMAFNCNVFWVLRATRQTLETVGGRALALKLLGSLVLGVCG